MAGTICEFYGKSLESDFRCYSDQCESRINIRFHGSSFPAAHNTNGKGKDGRGIGSHTDYGLLVIAAADDVGGNASLHQSELPGLSSSNLGQLFVFALLAVMNPSQTGRQPLPVSRKMMRGGFSSLPWRTYSPCFQASIPLITHSLRAYAKYSWFM